MQAYDCNNSWNDYVYSGLFVAHGTFGGRVFYKKQHTDENPVYINYFRWVAENNRWEQELKHWTINPGSTVWGQTIGELDFNTPGKIVYNHHFYFEPNMIWENTFIYFRLQYK